MARALRAWAIKGREKLGPQPAVRTSHSANKRLKAYDASYLPRRFLGVFQEEMSSGYIGGLRESSLFMRVGDE